MNWLVYHIASGQVFFTGVALVIFAAVVSARSNPVTRRITVLAFVIGAIAIAISSAAIPYWYYAVAIVVTVAWPLFRSVKTWRLWSRLAVIAVWTIAAALEIPYHVTPTLNQVESRSMTVIGDSITAGMGGSDRSERWPHILAREHDLTVQDISHMGETAASALSRVEGEQITSHHQLL